MAVRKFVSIRKIPDCSVAWGRHVCCWPISSFPGGGGGGGDMKRVYRTASHGLYVRAYLRIFVVNRIFVLNVYVYRGVCRRLIARSEVTILYTCLGFGTSRPMKITKIARCLCLTSCQCQRINASHHAREQGDSACVRVKSVCILHAP